MNTMAATYDPADNKLRLSSTTRLDADTYARVKAAGFAWAPRQDVFVAPMWTPAREDLLLELCGEIGDEDTTLVERAAQRADRFEDYSAHRQKDYQQARKNVAAIADGIPLGQPILVGHHSEKRARKDAERIQSGMATAVHLWEQSAYWHDRAKGALRHAKYKERPAVRARRIKGLEADLRTQQRTLAENEKYLAAWQKYGHSEKNAKDIAHYDHVSYRFPLADYPREPPASQYEGDMGLWSALDGGVITALQAQALAIPAHECTIAHTQRWIAHLTNRLAYERALLEESGGTVAEQTTPEKGGACRCWASYSGGWSYIVKVNKVSVSVLDNWGNGGGNVTRVIPFDKLQGVMTLATVTRLREEGRIIDHPDGTGFFRHDAPPAAPRPPMPTVPEDVQAMRESVKAGVQGVVVDQLFPTPPGLAARMVALADIQTGERVLEPNAGTGALLDAILAACPTANVEAKEQHPALVEQLTTRYPTIPVRCIDFLSLTPRPFFDVVLMHPPLSQGQDIVHVTHARQFLRPGGRLVTVMSAGITCNQDKAHTAFRALLAQDDATVEPLPADTFQASGTGVNTVLVVLRHAGDVLTTPTPASPLETLAESLVQAATATQARMTKERCALEWETKQRATQPHAEPVGMFAQTQLVLW